MVRKKLQLQLRTSKICWKSWMAATCFEAPAIFYHLDIVLVYLLSPNVQTGKTDTCEINSGANFAFLGNIHGFRAPPLTKLNSPGTRHFGHSSSTAFFAVRIKRYPNSSSTFQLEKIVASGDVSLNPGPEKMEFLAIECQRISRKLKISAAREQQGKGLGPWV